jgi:hypothetical protein
MSRTDYKAKELKRFAEIVMSSTDRKQMTQRLNGFRTGLINKHGKKRRLELWGLLISEYK